MSKRNLVFTTSICIVAVLALWASRSRPTQPPPVNEEISSQAATAPIAETRVAIASPSPSPSSSVIATAAQDQVAVPPTISTLRDEVRKDPHSTPHSLLRFGVDIGVRMEAAKSNPAEAQKLLGELKTCVTSDQGGDSPVQARALCLVSARELAQQWPGMQDDVEKLVKDADPQIIELATKIPGFAPKAMAADHQ